MAKIQIRLRRGHLAGLGVVVCQNSSTFGRSDGMRWSSRAMRRRCSRMLAVHEPVRREG